MKHQPFGMGEKEEYDQRGGSMYDPLRDQMVARPIGGPVPETTIKRSSTHMKEDWDGVGTADWVMAQPMKGGLTDIYDRLVNLYHKARDLNGRTVRIYEHFHGPGSTKCEVPEIAGDLNGLLKLIDQRLTALEALASETNDRVEDIVKSIA